ncbi:Protein kinase-like (PK-like) [Glarea lozoyensis ATCC 20868]|uniref:Protein kinase-like (PK-like) n=1 Tax=Glarea lozoyensis (strain ATCC 20868 / MF5171) TaxID=1116229 RepID=S3DID9_GLAL2|nr:Protein kinase-like (PK-like) [Glarea lozoyensis ATCC 20868]EPE31771.1 Protein kinase-like (PK-like) [Glarea lozoyensis ATCC 20868]
MTYEHLPLWIRIRTWDRFWKRNKTYQSIRETGAKVRYIGNNQLLKIRCHTTEYEAMEFVRRNTSIPVPKVFGVYSRPDGYQDLVMELVPGQELGVAWQTLTTEHKINVAKELGSYISQLRSLEPTKKGFVGSIGLASGWDSRLGSRRFGPFETIEDFHRFVRRGDSMDLWAIEQDVVDVHSRSDSYTTKFTHADMSPENIIVRDGKITAIIDWEFSGWFPEYWEYTKMHFRWRPYRKDFYQEMDKVLTSYPQELACDKALLKHYDFFSYDTDRPRRSVDEEKWREWDTRMRSRMAQFSGPPFSAKMPVNVNNSEYGSAALVEDEEVAESPDYLISSQYGSEGTRNSDS